MDYYNKIVESYDELYGEEQSRKLSIIKDKIKNPGLVLDVGSGTGIAKNFFKNIVCIDPSFNMLKKDDICAKAEFLPFKDKSFDTIICVTVIHHLNLNKFIKEVKRICKKNIAISILKKAKNFEEIKNKLKENFNFEEIDEEKDLILIKHVE